MRTTIDHSCPACGAPDPGQSQGRMVYAARGRGEPPIYVCGPECYQVAYRRAIKQRTCPECRSPFDLDDLVADYYCSRACAKAAVQRRRRVFKTVVRNGGTPNQLD